MRGEPRVAFLGPWFVLIFGISPWFGDFRVGDGGKWKAEDWGDKGILSDGKIHDGISYTWFLISGPSSWELSCGHMNGLTWRTCGSRWKHRSHCGSFVVIVCIE